MKGTGDILGGGRRGEEEAATEEGGFAAAEEEAERGGDEGDEAGSLGRGRFGVGGAVVDVEGVDEGIGVVVDVAVGGAVVAAPANVV